MPSAALRTWRTIAARKLDELVQAHVAVGGSAPGRRYATLQVNHAYTVLLASQFQRFCRDLHSEAVAFIVGGIPALAVGHVVQRNLLHARRLDVGNANAGALGADFSRLGVDFWTAVARASPRHYNPRRTKLQLLNDWRNAIAHQDWARVGGASTLHLRTVQGWRATCNAFGNTFDEVVRTHLTNVVGHCPW